jgi:hypothetical protein
MKVGGVLRADAPVGRILREGLALFRLDLHAHAVGKSAFLDGLHCVQPRIMKSGRLLTRSTVSLASACLRSNIVPAVAVRWPLAENYQQPDAQIDQGVRAQARAHPEDGRGHADHLRRAPPPSQPIAFITPTAVALRSGFTTSWSEARMFASYIPLK